MDDRLADLIRQMRMMDELNVIIRKAWFTSDFMLSKPDAELPFIKFRKKEHDISKKGMAKLVKDIVGLCNSMEESFLVFGVEESNKILHDVGCNLEELKLPYLLQDEEKFRKDFLDYANEMPELSCGVLYLNSVHKLFSCIRIRCNNLEPIKYRKEINAKYKIPKRKYISNNIETVFIEEEEFNNDVANLFNSLNLKLPKELTKYVWINCYEFEFDFVPNAHFLIDFSSNNFEDFKFEKMIHMPNDWKTKNSKASTIPTIKEFERYHIYYSQKFNALERLISNAKEQEPFVVILFYPSTVEEGIQIAYEIDLIMQIFDTVSYVCFTSSYWIEFNGQKEKGWNFLVPKETTSSCLLVPISPLCLKQLLCDINLDFPFKKTNLERIGCEKWLIDDFVDNNRDPYEFFRGGGCKWSDRNKFEFVLNDDADTIRNSKGLCIEHDSGEGGTSYAIFLMKLLSKEYKLYFIDGKNLIGDAHETILKEIPENSILFVDDVLPGIQNLPNKKLKFKLLVTKNKNIPLKLSLQTTFVPKMDCKSARYFSKLCLEVDDGRFPSSADVPKTHEMIISKQIQNPFLLSFTRFISNTIKPEDYISSLLYNMPLEKRNNIRLLAIVGKFRLYSEYIWDKQMLMFFEDYQKSVHWFI